MPPKGSGGRGRSRRRKKLGLFGVDPATADPSVDTSVIRGIYAEEEETDERFKKVLTFDDAASCKAFIKSIEARTNPQPNLYPECKQIYTHLVDWDQVCRHMLPKLEEYRRRFPVRPPPELPASNAYLGVESIDQAIKLRLDLPFHRRVCEESSLNTLRYLFFHMRCGLFVMIRENKIKMFVPFVNKDFRNTWGTNMTIDAPSVEEYYAEKRQITRRDEDVLPDIAQWWANGNIICNVMSEHIWGDSYLPQIKHMLEELCEHREVADVEFFINKRDYPHLKVSETGDLTEPYEFIFDKDDVPLVREKYSTYAPVGSFFISTQFADLPLTCTDDWETATGKVYPPGANDVRSAANRSKGRTAWEDRQATAIFRGNSTGPGVVPETNQRLKLAQISAQWKYDPTKNEHNPIDGIPYLDAGVVGFNLRDRKVQGLPMTFVKAKELPFEKVEKVPMYKQQKYKYQIYVDGHVAAMRYASMMVLGSVILRVESYTKAGDLWFFPILHPYDIRAETPDPAGDHIQIDKDLSNLEEVISWCKTHDSECQQIVANAERLHARLMSKDGQLDYMQLLLHETAQRFKSKRLPPPPGPTTPMAVKWNDEGFDWFGMDNIRYSSVDLTELSKPPTMLEFATTQCSCVSCQKYGPITAAAAGNGGGQASGAAAGAGGPDSGSPWLGGSSGAGSAAAAGQPTGPPPPVKPAPLRVAKRREFEASEQALKALRRLQQPKKKKKRRVA